MARHRQLATLERRLADARSDRASVTSSTKTQFRHIAKQVWTRMSVISIVRWSGGWKRCQWTRPVDVPGVRERPGSS